MKIQPATSISGRLNVPGDKSISHRAAIIAALADGTSRLSNYSTSQDCASTLSCLRSLGVGIERQGNDVRVVGQGVTGLSKSAVPLDCGNSGSTMRMLAGVLAGLSFPSVLTGDDSLQGRPMKRIVEPLSLMGAKIDSDAGRPPLQIEPAGQLEGIYYELPVASAQVKSCILLAALNARGRTEVVESLGPTRDHTERMLRWFGLPLEIKPASQESPTCIVVDGPLNYSARDVTVPGDISSAAFLIAAAALLPGSELLVEDVGLNPTRAQLVPLLRSLGFAIDVGGEREVCNEPVGDIKVSCQTLPENQLGLPARVAGQITAQLIDELPLLAVIGTQLSHGLEIRDAAELRYKETDRIAAVVTNLRAMGVEVVEYEDGLAIGGSNKLRGARLKSFGDHRIAMAFTVAALLAGDESELEGADCVAVSFPEFFAALESMVRR